MKKRLLILTCLLGCVLTCQAIVTEQLELAKNEIQEIRAGSQSVNSKCKGCKSTCKGCKSKCSEVGCSTW